jgi:uncharacterized protein with HEPN domain
MPRDPRAYLWDMQQASRLIASFLFGKDLAAYESDPLLRSAVERQFEIMGEAMTQLAKVEPDLAATIPHWREIIAFRNLLIHGYAVIEDARVWRIAQFNLPEMAGVIGDRLTDR